MKVEKFDVILVDFGKDIIDSEQGGIRPAIVVQNAAGNMFSTTTIVFPLTKQIKKLDQPTHTLIRKSEDNGLELDSMVVGEAVRQISTSSKRILRKLGKITDDHEKRELRRVNDANFGE